MPHYVALLRYTAQGIAKVKESPSRLDAARKAAAAMGGKIHAWYLTMGHHDAVLIAEFPPMMFAQSSCCPWAHWAI